MPASRTCMSWPKAKVTRLWPAGGYYVQPWCVYCSGRLALPASFDRVSSKVWIDVSGSSKLHRLLVLNMIEMNNRVCPLFQEGARVLKFFWFPKGNFPSFSLAVIVDTNQWYHKTTILPGDISITIGSEYDWNECQYVLPPGGHSTSFGLVCATRVSKSKV